jgi:hypothetical protein
MSPDKREILDNIAEIAGGFIFGGIAFALSDAGLHVWSFISGWLSISCGIIITVHFIEKLGFKRPKTLLVVVLSLNTSLFGFLIFEEMKPEPYSHFELVLRNASSIGIFEFTNHVFSTLGPPNHPVRGVVIFPVTEKSGMDLIFSIENNGPKDADDVEVSVSVASTLSFDVDPGWRGVMSRAGYTVLPPNGPPEKVTSNAYEYSIGELLNGDCVPLPPLHLHKLLLTPFETEDFPAIWVVMKAKDCPVQRIRFLAAFMLVSTNAPFMNPVLSQMTTGPDGQVRYVTPPEIAQEMIKP